MALDAFDRWCVRQNIEHAKTEGVESIVAQLRANGYPAIADAVQAETRTD